MTEQNIIDMYVHLRNTNMSIPSEALDEMKGVCLDSLKSKTCESCEYYEVSKFHKSKLCYHADTKVEAPRYLNLVGCNKWESKDK